MDGGRFSCCTPDAKSSRSMDARGALAYAFSRTLPRIVYKMHFGSTSKYHGETCCVELCQRRCIIAILIVQ